MKPLVRFESHYEYEVWQSELSTWDVSVSSMLNLTAQSLLLNTTQVLGKSEIFQSRMQLQEDLFEGPFFHCIDLISRSINIGSHLFRLTHSSAKSAESQSEKTFFSDQIDVCNYVQNRFEMILVQPSEAKWLILTNQWKLPFTPKASQKVILHQPKLPLWKDPRLFLCKSMLIPSGIHPYEAIGHIFTQGDSAFGYAQCHADFNIWTSVDKQEPDERVLFELVRLASQWTVFQAKAQEHLDWTLPAERLLSHLQKRFAKAERFDLVLYFHTLELRLQNRFEQLEGWVVRWRDLLQSLKFGEQHPDILKILFEIRANVRSWEDAEEMGEKLFCDRTDDISHHQIKRISESLFYWKQKVQFEIRLLQSLQRSLEDTYESQI